jgi:poly(glycerol-phosphate) alpha-glucosyltransferase
MPSYRKPSILDVWQYIEPRFGGVGPAAAALAKSVRSASDWSFCQVAFCNPDESKFADGIGPETFVVKVPGRRPVVDRRLRLALSELLKGASLCHVHGIWQPHSLAVQSIAARLGKPVIASAHGMLEKWELKHKAIRKRIYSTLFERPSLSHSACLRALSAEEANDYRRYGLANPIAIIPNGVRQLDRAGTAEVTKYFPQLVEKDVVLYLSRIHQKKGILNLIRAWPDISAAHRRAHLLIAGPEYPEAAAAAREIIARSGIGSSVTFAGTIAGTEKISALSFARCFCLPSYSEGQSIAVLEALSIGLPVVITPACNVDGVAESGAGLVDENTPAAIAKSIVTILQLKPTEWQAMSQSARHLARTQYNWSNIGEQMKSVYQWMLGGPKPSLVSN